MSSYRTPINRILQWIGSSDLQIGREFDLFTYVLATKNSTEATAFDRTKMDLNDLFFGWMKVVATILDTAGDIRSYIKHLSFAAQMYHSCKFTAKRLIDYDSYIVQRVVNGTMPSFGPDPI